MKKLVFTILISVLIASCSSQPSHNQFVLNGRIAGLENGWLYLYYSDLHAARVKDSSEVKKGKFVFSGNIGEPTMAYLQLKEENRNEKNTVSFFLEPATIRITMEINKFAKARFEGSAVQNEMDQLTKAKESVMKQLEPIQAEFEVANSNYIAARKAGKDEVTLASLKTRADEVREKFDPFNRMSDQIDYRFFDNHPQSYVTAYMLVYHVSELPLDSLQLFYGRLGGTIRQTAQGRDLGKQIEQLRNGSPGSPAKDFATVDINGKPISLTDFRGKYVLLDFWASWCGPCRKGNPHLKEIYARLGNKGLEIIGISDDDSKPAAWRAAVEKDGLPWRHVLRGFDMAKRMKNEPNETDISDKFGIHTLPTKILIDPQGMIIGRYSEEEGPLDKKLEEVFPSR